MKGGCRSRESSRLDDSWEGPKGKKEKKMKKKVGDSLTKKNLTALRGVCVCGGGLFPSKEQAVSGQAGVRPCEKKNLR